MKKSPPKFTKLKAPQRRIYVYPDGFKADFFGVNAVAVSESGTHRLECKDGRKFIVAPGWKYIELFMKDWTF